MKEAREFIMKCFHPDSMCVNRGSCIDLHLYVCKRNSGNRKDWTIEFSVGRKMETHEQYFRHPADDCG